jgi:hypothetical protein
MQYAHLGEVLQSMGRQLGQVLLAVGKVCQQDDS